MAGVFAGGEPERAPEADYREVQDFEQLRAAGLEVLEAFGQWLHDRDARAELRTYQHVARPGVPRVYVCTAITRWVVYAVTAESMTAAMAGAATTVDEKLRELFAKTQPGTGPLEGSAHVEG